MESELFGIFQVKLVAKNIVLGFPGTHLLNMKVTNIKKKAGWLLILQTLVNLTISASGVLQKDEL